MILRDAMKSLRFGLAQAVFYWLTLLLTTMFLYLYFIMMMSDSVTAGFLTEGTDFLATAVTVTVIIICMTAILFANSFFVRRKAKELAVRLISGATYTQLSIYLLGQTLFLMAAAMPVGLVLGRVLLPVLSSWISQRSGMPYTITVNSEGIMMASFFLGFVVFWIIMLNLSFAYRNAANMMFSNPVGGSSGSRTFYMQGAPGWLKGAVSLLLFLGPIVMFFVNPHALFLFGLMSCAGLYLSVNNVLVPLITKQNRNRTNAAATASSGFLRSDLRILIRSIILYFLDAVLLLNAITMKDGQPVEMAMYVMSYGIMNVMLSLSVLFQFASEASGRGRLFQTLGNIGFTEKARTGIRRRELLGLFGFLFILAVLYIGMILVSVLHAGRITPGFAGILFLTGILPLAGCWLFCRVFYDRAVRLTNA